MKRPSVSDRAKLEFERVTAEHELTVLQDNGVWRHLRFAKPGTWCGWYTLVTWPGVLCINGDYGSFVFTRIQDMFEFFRSPAGRINPSYWSEKCVAADRHDGMTEWSPELFTAAVVSDFRSYWRDDDRSRRRECFRELRERVLRHADDPHDAMQAVYTFEFDRFTLECFYEHRLEEYTLRFIWCLHAIVRGIQMYDALSATPAKVEASG